MKFSQGQPVPYLLMKDIKNIVESFNLIDYRWKARKSLQEYIKSRADDVGEQQALTEELEIKYINAYVALEECILYRKKTAEVKPSTEAEMVMMEEAKRYAEEEIARTESKLQAVKLEIKEHFDAMKQGINDKASSSRLRSPNTGNFNVDKVSQVNSGVANSL